MDYTLTGTIHDLGETQSFGVKGFTKRDLIINTGGQYPQYIKVEGHTDTCEEMNALRKGMSVEVTFRLRGKQATNGVFYNTLLIKSWKVLSEKSDEPLPAPAKRDTTAMAPNTSSPRRAAPPPPVSGQEGVDENVPF